MKRLILLMVIAALCLLPVQAQDGCAIDLLDEISSLAEAQRVATPGDTDTAAELVMSVRDQLTEHLELCAGDSGPLPITFEFPDGLFRFGIPEGWARLSPVEGVYVLGNDQEAVDITVKSNISEAIPAGSQIITTAYGNSVEMFSADDLEDFVLRLGDDAFSDVTFLPAEDVEINGYAGVKMPVSSDLFEGAAYVLDLGGDDKLAFFLGLTPAGEFAAFEPTFDAIVASMEVGEKQSSGEPTPVPTVVAQPTGQPLSEITYREAHNIREYIEDIDSHTATLSPDGAYLAWVIRTGDRAICLYGFADFSRECAPIPEIFGSTPPLILWSPDSRYIAFTQDGIIRMDEPDIWVFNVETRTFANRTDDRINYFNLLSQPDPDDSPGPLWYDYTFTWGPDGNIYFIRYETPTTESSNDGTTGLYRVAPDSGEAELIRDITAAFARFSIYQYPQYDLNGVLAVSPDATQIALNVMQPDRNAPENGIWLMPLSGDEVPRQLIPASDFTEGLTAEVRDTGAYLYPMGLAWTPDQTGLFVYANNPQFQVDATFNLYHVAIASGSVTPLLDFSQYTRAELFSIDDSGRSPAFYLPHAAVMSPDGTTPLMFNFELGGGLGGLTAFIPADDGYEMTTLIEFEYSPVPGQHSSVSADGKVLMFGTLFLPTE